MTRYPSDSCIHFSVASFRKAEVLMFKQPDQFSDCAFLLEFLFFICLYISSISLFTLRGFDYQVLGNYLILAEWEGVQLQEICFSESLNCTIFLSVNTFLQQLSLFAEDFSQCHSWQEICNIIHFPDKFLGFPKSDSAGSYPLTPLPLPNLNTILEHWRHLLRKQPLEWKSLQMQIALCP
jgi:hypothetical protein